MHSSGCLSVLLVFSDVSICLKPPLIPLVLVLVGIYKSPVNPSLQLKSPKSQPSSAPGGPQSRAVLHHRGPSNPPLNDVGNPRPRSLVWFGPRLEEAERFLPLSLDVTSLQLLLKSSCRDQRGPQRCQLFLELFRRDQRGPRRQWLVLVHLVMKPDHIVLSVVGIPALQCHCECVCRQCSQGLFESWYHSGLSRMFSNWVPNLLQEPVEGQLVERYALPQGNRVSQLGTLVGLALGLFGSRRRNPHGFVLGGRGARLSDAVLSNAHLSATGLDTAGFVGAGG